jgi:hypothetical protein
LPAKKKLSTKVDRERVHTCGVNAFNISPIGQMVGKEDGVEWFPGMDIVPG